MKVIKKPPLLSIKLIESRCDVKPKDYLYHKPHGAMTANWRILLAYKIAQ